jgi:cytochrome c-type biogenesis protein
MIDLTLGGIFIAGLISFISPCVLPLVPPYLCYMTGISLDELSTAGANSKAAIRRRVTTSSLTFVLGFTTVFVLLGATASVIGQFISQHLAWLSVIAGVIIILMGLHFLGVFKISALYREARFNMNAKPAGPLGSYIMGLAFAFGWTPCIGPVLAAVLFVAGAEDTVGQGAAMLAVYSLGLGIPFVIAALFSGAFLGLMTRFRHHIGKVEKAMGVLLVLTGILFITGQMANMSFWLLETFPVFQTIG